MKLYVELVKLLENMTLLRRAWFTSFNMNPMFVEKYILPALAGSQDNRPVKVYDYETLQQALEKQDIRFFCDCRAIELSEGKKTSIPFHLVDVNKLQKKFTGGVFHPKVVFIQGDIKGEPSSYLICSSANLTISGWGRNREGVLIREIRDRWNAEKVCSFFRVLFNNELPDNFDADAWVKSLPAKSTDWEFVSSFDKDDFLDKLLPQETPELYAWSPYFSRDIVGLIRNNLKPKGIEKAYVVPDLSGSGEKMRLADSKEIRAARDLQFMKDPVTNKSNEQSEPFLTHAKVWLTREKLAVGSWNFTDAGINQASGNANNIEAGIIIDITKHDFHKLIGNLQKLADPRFMTASEIDDSRIGLSDWNCSCDVVADWSTFRYYIKNCTDIDPEKTWVALPGYKDPVKFEDFGSYFPFDTTAARHLLKDRLFYLKDPKGAILFTGVVIEQNASNRPIWGFENLDEYIFAWLDSSPKTKPEQHKPWYPPGTPTGDPEEEDDNDSESEKVRRPSWFSLFMSLANIKKKLSESRDNGDQLRDIAMKAPGNIVQLVEHVKEVLDHNDYTDVFKWYLINETNDILKRLKRYQRKHSGIVADLALEPLKPVELPFSGPKKRRHRQWLNIIRQECGYD